MAAQSSPVPERGPPVPVAGRGSPPVTAVLAFLASLPAEAGASQYPEPDEALVFTRVPAGVIGYQVPPKLVIPSPLAVPGPVSPT
jgi:hypothetical protein